MNVLVVGSGGREHALAWSIAKSSSLEKLYTAPGNGGTALLGENVPLNPFDFDSLVDFARNHRVDLVVVGPEAPLVQGIVDRFDGEGLLCFGPTRNGAKLEGSKVFAKEFMKRHGIPTADFEIYDDPNTAKEAIRERGAPIVVKADGLAAGKGVMVAKSTAQAEKAVDAIMVEKRFGESGQRVIIETCLEGEELSVHAICCGRDAVLLPSSQDHKRAFDNDEGPNTGGMGAYAPVPLIGKEESAKIYASIIAPVLEGMKHDGSPFRGVLYAGLMLTDSGPQVLEFNVRFGDPETQALVPLIKSDLLEILHRAASGKLPDHIELHEGLSASTVVMASKGYPESYEKGFVINGMDAVDDERRVVFHAGTVHDGERWITSGGRVLAVTSVGKSLADALAHTYEGVEKIHFEGAHWRKDIGKRGL